MSEPLHPSQMTNKDKFKALLKQVAVSAAINAVPGTVQFIAEVGHKAYELWLASPPEDRESFRVGAEQLSEAERDLAAAEIERETGVTERAVVDVMVQSMQGMRSVGDDEALRSINATLSRATNGQATLTPQPRMLRRSAIGTIMGASNRSVDVSGRSSWPQVEGFEISGVLGKGASGVVYLAKHTSAGGRICALKVGDLVSASRFQREVVAMGAVEHENLIDLWGSGELAESPPRYWIAMPNIGGLTLADLWRQGQLNLPEKLRLMGEVLSGLAALHRAGLVHRDLKPANALVTPTLSVRLADFGLSKESVKAGEATMTATSMGLEGTPAYMSPEQVNEVREAGAEVDVWSFGVMLYEALSGERPFGGQNIMRLGMEILTKTIDLDGDWAPRELRSILKTSLERDQSKRYRDAIEMERPYREGAAIIIARFNHNELREIWEALERNQVLLKISSIDELSETYDELLNSERERISDGLKIIGQWRSKVTQLQAKVEQAEQSMNDFQLALMHRSTEIAHQAMRISEELKAQWWAWHRGLCDLESEEQSCRASLSALRLQARGEESFGSSLHQEITAWGRAQYDERDQAESLMRAKVQDLHAELSRRVQQAKSDVGEVGAERERDFDRQRAQGRGEGELAAKEWVADLEQLEGATLSSQGERESAARSAIDERLSVWSRLSNPKVDHDRAGAAWRKALDDGSLVTFCLERALNLPDDPSRILPELSAVSPKQLGEILAAGVRVALESALKREFDRTKNQVQSRARQGLTQEISSRLELGEGVARLQEAGRAVGFEEGFGRVVRALSSASLEWSEQDRRAVDQALRAKLKVAHEELVAAQRRVSRKRIGMFFVFVALAFFISMLTFYVIEKISIYHQNQIRLSAINEYKSIYQSHFQGMGVGSPTAFISDTLVSNLKEGQKIERSRFGDFNIDLSQDTYFFFRNNNIEKGVINHGIYVHVCSEGGCSEEISLRDSGTYPKLHFKSYTLSNLPKVYNLEDKRVSVDKAVQISEIIRQLTDGIRVYKGQLSCIGTLCKELGDSEGYYRYNSCFDGAMSIYHLNNQTYPFIIECEAVIDLELYPQIYCGEWSGGDGGCAKNTVLLFDGTSKLETIFAYNDGLDNQVIQLDYPNGPMKIEAMVLCDGECESNHVKLSREGVIVEQIQYGKIVKLWDFEHEGTPIKKAAPPDRFPK